MPRPSGTHFLQIPGPTNVPESILRAMARPTIDHRSAEFSRLGLDVLDGLKEVFETAVKLCLDVQFVSGDWRHGVDSQVVESALSEDARRQIKAVMVVHNETS